MTTEESLPVARNWQPNENDKSEATARESITHEDNTFTHPSTSLPEIYSTFASPSTCLILVTGCVFAALSGIAIPGLVYFVSQSVKELSASSVGMDTFMESVRIQSFALMGLGGFAFITQTVQHGAFGYVAATMTRELKIKWFDALLNQDTAYYDRLDNVAGHATQLSVQAQNFQSGLGTKLGSGIQFAFTLVFSLVLAFVSSWQIALLILATFPLVALAMINLFRVNGKKQSFISQNYASAGNIVYTTIASIKTILSLDMMDHQMSQFQQATSLVLQAATKYSARVGAALGIAFSAFLAIFLVVALYGSYLLYDQVRQNGCDPSGAIQPDHTCDPEGADVLGALLAIVLATWGLPQITDAFEGLSESRAACAPALALIRKQYDGMGKRTDSQGAISVKSVSAATPYKGLCPENARGHIRFQNVAFAYPTRKEQTVFKSLNLDIPAGSKVAFVGDSGSGKSTIIQLMMRLYEPDTGSISLDGHDLQSINLQWLRKTVGLVGQEPVLFSGVTIRDNIAIGLSEATPEMVEDAARQANAHSFISEFPDGYNTILRSQGQLSGGQKQRIAIARCLIRKSKVLLLDEATSALDSASERVVQEALDNLMAESDRTMLIVAHRLSTIKHADWIVVVKDGAVVEQGIHGGLLGQKGAYYDLVQAQQATQLETATLNTCTVRNSTLSTLIEQESNTAETLVEFKHACFAYPSRSDQVILRGLNLAIRRGETIGLCGPSGNGKSTVMQLIERFYDVSDGSVHYDGQDIRQLNPRSLRKRIGLVSQEPTLFKGSILENIQFGNPEATQDMIFEASKRANAHGFISSFAAGYDTQVGEAGTQLSGGQKQRLAIARALVRNPSLILFDEATSALDSKSERIVQEALDEIMNDRKVTMIVIAHRLSTIVKADRIAVVADGGVVEVGSHEELLNKTNGLYSRLYALQLMSSEDRETFNSKTQRRPRNALVRSSTRRLTRRKSSMSLSLRSMDLSGLSSVFDIDNNTGLESGLESKGGNEEAMELSSEAMTYFSGLFRRHYQVLAFGVVGEILSSLVFPVWGLLLACIIEVLHTPVLPCNVDDANYICEDEYNAVAEEMQERSIWIAGGCLMAMLAAVLGSTVSAHGFGTASERFTKDIRDEAFKSLLRQEAAYYDCHHAASLAALIEEDVSKINAMMGDPVRGIVGAMSSIVVGLVIAFIHMWPVALLAIAVMPFKIFSSALQNAQLSGGNTESDSGKPDDTNGENTFLSSSGLALEALTNMKTVASLSLEENRLNLYTLKLDKEAANGTRQHVLGGMAAGLAELVRMWIYAIIFWFGGWVLSRFPEQFTYEDFLITMFVFLFSVAGLAGSVAKLSERGAAKEAATRVFALISRKSEIDSLSDDGRLVVEMEGP